MSDAALLHEADLAEALAEMPAPGADARREQRPPLGNGFRLTDYLDGIKNEYIHEAMEQAKGVKAEAARLLGLPNYQTLDNALKKLGIAWRK